MDSCGSTAAGSAPSCDAAMATSSSGWHWGMTGGICGKTQLTRYINQLAEYLSSSSVAHRAKLVRAWAEIGHLSGCRRVTAWGGSWT